MKTFVTSSLLAVLSAVVFGWFLVQQGGELPRRSLDSYPPMVSGLEPLPPGLQRFGESREEGGGDTGQVPESDPPTGSQVAEKAAPVALGDPAPPRHEALEAPLPEDEPFGPPAPVLPFVLNINAAEERVSLQGSIPTREIKEEIEKILAATFAGEELDNRLKFSPETRSGLWIRYLPDFLGRYFHHTGGAHEVTIVDGKLILAGSVVSRKSKEAILKWAQPLKKHGLVLEESVSIDESLQGKVAEVFDPVMKGKKAEAE